MSTSLPYVRLDPAALAPSYAKDGDAGLDLSSVEALTLAPLSRALVRTGIAIALPRGMCGLVLPRSGLAAHSGITLLNAPGLIDSGYRGELKVVLYNADPLNSFEVEVGMRIAQLLVMPFPAIALVAQQVLDDTERGAGGFGHSGLHGAVPQP
ncbi:MAG: dUTP diphosphatase [Acidimicrobiales bacterium]